MNTDDENKPQSLTPSALSAGVKLQAGAAVKISVVGKVGRPLPNGGAARKPASGLDDGGDATGAAAGANANGGQKVDGSNAGSDGSTSEQGEGMDVEWSFVKPDGTPLADQKCTITADDGTELTAQLEGGVLKLRVPPGHLIIEVEGHIIGQVNVQAAA